MTNNEKLTPVEKVEKLLYAEINFSPEEIVRVCAELGEVDCYGRVFGFAFRYRCVESIKALVEGGASLEDQFPLFINTLGIYADDYSVFLLEDGILRSGVAPDKFNLKRADGTELKPQPFEIRAETVRYLYEHGEKAGFVPGRLLYFAILFNDERMTEELKRLGAELTEKHRMVLTERGKPNDLLVWTSILKRLPAEYIAPVLKRLSEELGGEKFHNTKGIYEALFDKLHLPENLKFYLENFDAPSPNKTKILKLMIDKSSIGGLEFAESLGWLKQPRKRDELISYASEQKSTECAAWLLDFKNRTADLAAEQAKAEKKQQRELNAAPDSVAVLKTLWSFKKREDGTIIINGYKGDRTEIEVPAKIGKSPVMAIAAEALCPYKGGVIKKTNGRFLKTITEITLPASIVEIGEKALAYIDNLTVKAPRGSFAEKYCKEHNISYIPKGDK